MRRRRPLSPAALTVFGLIAPGLGHAQVLGGGASGRIDAVRVLAALGLCLFLAVVAALLLRRRQGAPARLGWSLPAWPGAPAAPRRVSVIERLRLTPQLEVCVLKWDDREVLVGATPAGGFVILPAPGPEERAP